MEKALCENERIELKSILLLKIKFYKQTYCNAVRNMYNSVCVQKV